MGLCKCPKRKVTNLFCFEHDVNVCEYCLVSDHERCIVQSYVQWLQDSDYNPICILCKNALKDEETIRLICYDVFHWSCIDKYASQLPANTAPAGYQCPKCKECIFPPPNLVSPVVDILKKRLESASWSRVGLGQSLLAIEETPVLDDVPANIPSESPSEPSSITGVLRSTNSPVTDDESNGFVIVKNQQKSDKSTENLPETTAKSASTRSDNLPGKKQQFSENLTQYNETKLTNTKSSPQVKVDMNRAYNESSEKNLYHNRATQFVDHDMEPSYDPNLGMVLSISNLDRDTGDYKYQRRPLFEWLSRWLKSRQLSNRIRMTRQKKILFIIIFIFMGLFTMILVLSSLGSMSTENDPALDPMNNPNIRINI